MRFQLKKTKEINYDHLKPNFIIINENFKDYVFDKFGWKLTYFGEMFEILKKYLKDFEKKLKDFEKKLDATESFWHSATP